MTSSFPTHLADLGSYLPGAQCSGNPVFQGLSIDSRNLSPGNVFIALNGARDGHAFIEAAAAAGAAGAIVSAPSRALPTLQVENTRRALEQIGMAYRALFDGVMLALTGSQGKTSTRGFLGAIMQAAVADSDAVLITRGNLNNHLGVPLTLSRLTEKTKAAVLELGASAVGDIQQLGQWVRPHIGCVLNARDAHLETFGSLANIVRGKGELIDCVSLTGTVVLPAEEPAFAQWKAQVGSRDLWTFGREAGDFRYIPLSDRHAKFSTPLGTAEVQLPTIGQHFMANAAAAMAMAMAAGADLEACVQGLSSAVIEPGRMTPLQGLNGHLVVDDTYNASPQAVRVAIDWLSAQPGERALILGELAELGAAGEQLMVDLGQYARAAGIEYLITCGAGAPIGRDFPGARHFETVDDLCAVCAELPDAAATLVKGSRSAQMDRVVDALTGRAGGLH